ncbi:hypothetical protein N9Y17_01120, partial [Gammaproteobacteria bacterium]|nr:hypothetical protein [Gammaproteobacteria bacterium]
YLLFFCKKDKLMTLDALIETLKNKSDADASKHLNENHQSMQTLVKAMQSDVEDKLKLLEIPFLKQCAEYSYIYQNLIESDKEGFIDLRCVISFRLPEIVANTKNYNEPTSLLPLWKHIEGKGKDLANNECSTEDISISYEKIEQIDEKIKSLDADKTQQSRETFNEQIKLLKKILNKEEFDQAKIDINLLLFRSNVWMLAFLASNNESLVKERFQSFHGLNDEQIFQILKIFEKSNCLDKIKQEDAQKACMVTLDKRFDFDSDDITQSDEICSRIFNSIHQQHSSQINDEHIQYVAKYNSTDDIINVLTKNYCSLVLNEKVLFDSLANETQGFVDYIFDNFDELEIANVQYFIDQLLESIKNNDELMDIEDFKRYAQEIAKKEELSGTLVFELVKNDEIDYAKVMIQEMGYADEVVLSAVDYGKVDSDFLNLVTQYYEFSGDHASLEEALKKVLLHIENKKEFVIFDQLFQDNLSLDQLYVEVKEDADQGIDSSSKTTKKTVIMLAYDLGYMQVVDWLIENKYKEVIANKHLTDDDKQKLEPRRQDILQDLEDRISKLKEQPFVMAKVDQQASFFKPQSDHQPNKREMSEADEEQGKVYKRQRK